MNTGKGSDAEAAEKRLEAFKYYIKGWTYRQIGQLLGLSHVRVHQYIKEHLAELNEQTKELAKLLRERQLTRLDEMISAIWIKAIGGDLFAVDRIEKLMAQQNKLLNLDNHPKETNVRLTLEDLLAGSYDDPKDPPPAKTDSEEGDE